MVDSASPAISASAARERSSEALRDLAWGVAPLVGAAGASWLFLDLPASYMAVVASMYIVLGVILTLGARTLPFPALGAPNRVTLARATLVLPVAALTLPPVGGQGIDAPGYWWIVTLASVALALDGLDGRLARTRGEASELGARFDMELDAFLLAALSVLIWQSGKAGAWVLAIGALRYAFVAAGWTMSSLRRDLPERWRRKAICVVQGVVLVTALAPVVPVGLAAGVLAAALVLLVYSFAVDVVWLMRAGS